VHVPFFDVDGQPLVSTESPFNPITMADVTNAINELRQREVGIVALSAHDSSDEAIERFRLAFGAAYHDVVVGEAVIVQSFI
jgi:7,8-dihydropterin-6-yl-methyl-4-(beta-D-ribofuranosyl)aminobenzene 5'-phosphate synthase